MKTEQEIKTVTPSVLNALDIPYTINGDKIVISQDYRRHDIFYRVYMYDTNKDTFSISLHK